MFARIKVDVIHIFTMVCACFYICVLCSYGAIIPFPQFNLMLDQATLSEVLGMILHTSHCYLVIPIFWTSCISRETAVTLATIGKHIIWTMS